MENIDITSVPTPQIPGPFWKRKKIILTIALIISAIIIGAVLCSVFSREKINLPAQYDNLIQQQKSAGQDSRSQNTADARLFVFIQNKEENIDKQLFAVPSDFYSNNVSGIEDQVEYLNNSLYIIRKMNDSGVDELWKFEKRDQFGKAPPGVKLYYGNDLGFNVSPAGKYIAITSSEKEKLSIINKDGNVIKEYNTRDLGFSDNQGAPFGFHLLDWSTNENEFWGTLGNKPLAEAMYKIDTSNWEVKRYDAPFNQEWEFNADSKKIVYSDCPVGQDSTVAKTFKDSETKISLEVYDVENGQNNTIDSAISKCFNPKWLSSKVIEYNNPLGDDRLSKIIN